MLTSSPQKFKNTLVEQSPLIRAFTPRYKIRIFEYLYKNKGEMFTLQEISKDVGIQNSKIFLGLGIFQKLDLVENIQINRYKILKESEIFKVLDRSQYTEKIIETLKSSESVACLSLLLQRHGATHKVEKIAKCLGNDLRKAKETCENLYDVDIVSKQGDSYKINKSNDLAKDLANFRHKILEKLEQKILIEI